LNPIWLADVVRRALNEYIGYGDLTTEAIVSANSQASGTIIAKEAGRIAGSEVAALAFHLLDPSVNFTIIAADGTDVQAGQQVAQVNGPAGPVLMGERVALNFMQNMSGIATITAQAVREAAPYKARIVDTRKTTPTLRPLEKYAVRMGGALNHRYGLDDAVLIKENHLAVAGGITQAVSLVRRRVGHMVKVEVEVEHLEQIPEALAAGVDAILLDNMDIPTMRQAVAKIAGRIIVEASGNITVGRVAEVAATGVDIISMGQLTRSAPALDLSLRLCLQ
jgi:nicotinate-nucleotide pyrophosphorylase (carboxylating)